MTALHNPEQFNTTARNMRFYNQYIGVMECIKQDHQFTKPTLLEPTDFIDLLGIDAFLIVEKARKYQQLFDQGYHIQLATALEDLKAVNGKAINCEKQANKILNAAYKSQDPIFFIQEQIASLKTSTAVRNMRFFDQYIGVMDCIEQDHQFTKPTLLEPTDFIDLLGIDAFLIVEKARKYQQLFDQGYHIQLATALEDLKAVNGKAIDCEEEANTILDKAFNEQNPIDFIQGQISTLKTETTYLYAINAYNEITTPYHRKTKPSANLLDSKNWPEMRAFTNKVCLVIEYRNLFYRANDILLEGKSLTPVLRMNNKELREGIAELNEFLQERTHQNRLAESRASTERHR